MKEDKTLDPNFKGSNLLKQFHGVLDSGIDEKGVWPHICLVRTAAGIEFQSLALTPEEALRHIQTQLTTRADDILELVFGLDMTTRPGQGTLYADVLALGWWHDGVWTSGVIDYQNEPRAIEPINWDNAHWNGVMARDILPRLKPFYRVVRNQPVN